MMGGGCHRFVGYARAGDRLPPGISQTAPAPPRDAGSVRPGRCPGELLPPVTPIHLVVSVLSVAGSPGDEILVGEILVRH